MQYNICDGFLIAIYARATGIPLILSALIVKPHPVTLYCYYSFHIFNNVLNHSGIDVWWFDCITLKILPLRSKNKMHDAHHRFSLSGTHAKNAKNYGEMYWLWDYKTRRGCLIFRGI